MKTQLVSYSDPRSGFSLFLVPESEIERGLLIGLWRHGELQVCNGVADGTGQGFCVRWNSEELKPEPYEEP